MTIFRFTYGLIWFTIMISLIIACSERGSQQGEEYVATVNGEKISLPEYKQVMRSHRAMIFNYFYEKYGVENDGQFWTTKYGDEIPIERLKNIALNECVRIKVQQLLAQQKNVISDISYDAFLKNYQTINNQRKEAMNAQKVIYGPVEFTEQTYFNYSFSAMVLQLKNLLAKKELAHDEDDLNDYYEHKKENYKRPDVVEVDKISVYVHNPQTGKPLMSRDAAKLLISHVKEESSRIEKFNIVAEKIGHANILVDKQVFDHTTAFTDNRLYYELKMAASMLSVGEISPIIEDDGGYHIIKCLTKRDGGYILFEEIRENIESDYLDDRYEQYIDQMVEKASIKINKKVYQSITEG